MDVPHVKREDYQLTDISDDGFLTLMSDNGEIREDLKLPEGELGNSLRSDFDNGKDLLVSIIDYIYKAKNDKQETKQNRYSVDKFSFHIIIIYIFFLGCYLSF